MGSTDESKYSSERQWDGALDEAGYHSDDGRGLLKASGVAGTHAHRFRYTLATEILVAGGSLEDAADVLGNSPNVIRKHYGIWNGGRHGARTHDPHVANVVLSQLS
jgi:hypothetical protein